MNGDEGKNEDELIIEIEIDDGRPRAEVFVQDHTRLTEDMTEAEFEAAIRQTGLNKLSEFNNADTGEGGTLMHLNWRVRLKNPLWWTQILGTMLLTALAYHQLEPSALTDWAALGAVIAGVVKNPYLLALCAWSAWGAINDPTVAGAGDSELAMQYTCPKNPEL